MESRYHRLFAAFAAELDLADRERDHLIEEINEFRLSATEGIDEMALDQAADKIAAFDAIREFTFHSDAHPSPAEIVDAVRKTYRVTTRYALGGETIGKIVTIVAPFAEKNGINIETDAGLVEAVRTLASKADALAALRISTTVPATDSPETIN